MNSNIKLPQRELYIILIFCSIIIFLNSMEVMIEVKDIDVYEEWLSQIKDSKDKDMDYYGLYLTWKLKYFFIKIIVPMALGIYSYFASKFTKINKIYVYTWILLLLGSLAFTVFELKFGYIFYYINIICYMVLTYTLLSLNKIINHRENL